jgi:two-component system, OmpR family, sensor histidine kinase KdpD
VVDYSDPVAADPRFDDIAGNPSSSLTGWLGYAGASAFCAGAALLAAPLAGALDIASLVLLFMLAVVLSAARFGRGPALLAACLSVLLLNLIFVPPRYSLAVADERFFFTFAVMLVVGLVVGHLTAGLKAQAQAARQREERVRSLYEISRELGRALAPEQVAEAVGHFAAAQLQGAASLWLIERGGALRPVGPCPAAAFEALARRAVETGRVIDPAIEPDSRTQELEGRRLLLLPLRATMAVRGALAVYRRGAGEWTAEDRRLLDTCATLLAGTLERIHYIEVAQATALEIEGERLRNALLSAISHDLRTPLSSLVGLAESLRLTRPGPTAQQAEIADAMAASARRMSALANNLLDMARLQAGAVRLDLQWQPLEEVVGAAMGAAASSLSRHRVVVRLAADLPWVRLDAVLMERVLVNLLENAVKYTPAGTEIEIAGAALGEEIELSVRDHGPGLPAGREEDLFKKFERGERESSTSGVGLGLALCRAIVSAHGGHIHAESLPQGGARFVMRFPRGSPPPAPPAEDLAEETAP